MTTSAFLTSILIFAFQFSACGPKQTGKRRGVANPTEDVTSKDEESENTASQEDQQMELKIAELTDQRDSITNDIQKIGAEFDASSDEPIVLSNEFKTYLVNLNDAQTKSIETLQGSLADHIKVTMELIALKTDEDEVGDLKQSIAMSEKTSEFLKARIDVEALKNLRKQLVAKGLQLGESIAQAESRVTIPGTSLPGEKTEYVESDENTKLVESYLAKAKELTDRPILNDKIFATNVETLAAHIGKNLELDKEYLEERKKPLEQVPAVDPVTQGGSPITSPDTLTP